MIFLEIKDKKYFPGNIFFCKNNSSETVEELTETVDNDVKQEVNE